MRGFQFGKILTAPFFVENVFELSSFDRGYDFSEEQLLCGGRSVERFTPNYPGRRLSGCGLIWQQCRAAYG